MSLLERVEIGGDLSSDPLNRMSELLSDESNSAHLEAANLMDSDLAALNFVLEKAKTIFNNATNPGYPDQQQSSEQSIDIALGNFAQSIINSYSESIDSMAQDDPVRETLMRRMQQVRYIVGSVSVRDDK